MTDLPPQPIPSSAIHIERGVDPVSKQVVTHYRNLQGEDVLPPTYHHQGAAGNFVPAPTVVEPHETGLTASDG